MRGRLAGMEFAFWSNIERLDMAEGAFSTLIDWNNGLFCGAGTD